MNQSFFILIILLVVYSGCSQTSSQKEGADDFQMAEKVALLTTRFSSLEELKEVIQIDYKKGKRPAVYLTHNSNGVEVTSVLKAGISEADIMEIRRGGIWGKIGLCFRSPYFVANRWDIMRVFILSRRRHNIFGWKDIAFYDIAEIMMNHIIEVGLTPQDSLDFSEKGYINTFNHVGSQALMTTMFSEKFADFMSDTHERSTLPELITGDFTEKQKNDIKNGAVDNYIDFINNEWGQELGKMLKKKYKINRQTNWTPELLCNYLNDTQNYYSEVLQIAFKPFNPEDEVVMKFSAKINRVMNDIVSLSKMKGI